MAQQRRRSEIAVGQAGIYLHIVNHDGGDISVLRIFNNRFDRNSLWDGPNIN
jgi:hypothetical protein